MKGQGNEQCRILFLVHVFKMRSNKLIPGLGASYGIDWAKQLCRPQDCLLVILECCEDVDISRLLWAMASHKQPNATQ